MSLILAGDVCQVRGPGCLECLAKGLANLLAVMDELAYEINLADSLDSGNGSGDETEDEPPSDLDVMLSMCRGCAKVVCKVTQRINFRSS